MGLVKNSEKLGVSELRKIALALIESGLSAIQPDSIMSSSFQLHDEKLVIKDKEYDLEKYERVFLVGIGKGSAYYASRIEEILEHRLSSGYVIDVTPENFSRVNFVRGTHPLPSEANLRFTENVFHKLSGLSEQDLVIVLICGGGSAMLVSPAKISLEDLIHVNEVLLKSGADIIEMNKLRKHLDRAKGGGLAQALHPATIASLIFSDVPGNDLSFIASGPTVRDETSIADAQAIVDKYHIFQGLDLASEILIETPKEDAYFARVDNILMLSNVTALEAMKARGQELGLDVEIISDKLQGEAREVGEELLSKLTGGKLLLAGGETTVTVKGEGGTGGRNQEVALGALVQGMDECSLVTSFASDGYDNSAHAGAIADVLTMKHAESAQVDPNTYLNNNDSYTFFEKTCDGIVTGRLPSNVADLFIAFKTDG